MQEIKIRDEYIKLGQLLKLSGIAGSGSDASYMISEGLIKLNDEVEIRRGKKVYPGDYINYEDNYIKVVG